MGFTEGVDGELRGCGAAAVFSNDARRAPHFLAARAQIWSSEARSRRRRRRRSGAGCAPAVVNNRGVTLSPSYSPPDAVKKLWRTKASNFARHPHARPRSLIEQPKRGGLKQVDASTAGIIPGDRGKVGGNWCRLPLQSAKADVRHLSPVPLAGVVSGQSKYELGTVPRGTMRNRAEWSQAHGEFRPVGRRSYPRGYGCYCADQNAIAFPAGRPRQKARLATRARRAKEARWRGENGPRQSP
jgi:hypothetical protein